MIRPTATALALLVALPMMASASVIWEANTSRGMDVFEGLERAPGTIDLQNDPKGVHGQVYHFNIWDLPEGGKERCEAKGTRLPDGTNYRLTRGNTVYIGWRSLYGAGIAQAQAWVALFQMHAYGGVGMGAPFVLRRVNDGTGRLYLQNNVVGTNDHIWSTPLVTEQWQRFVMRVHLDHRADVGWVEFWHNGVRQTFINGQQRYYCPTHEDNDGTYNRLKWGIYRGGGNSGNWHAWMSGARIGTTFEDVDPDRGVPPRVTPTPRLTPTPTATPRPTPIGDFVEITPSASGVSASTHDGNVPANAVDDDLATRWSANGDGEWLQLDLGSAQTLAFVKVATYAGHTRRARFDLQVATSSGSWSNVLTAAMSSGTTTNEETFDFPDVSARWVRYLGHGNTDPTKGSWNSVSEISAFAPAVAATPTPTATPSPTPTPTATPGGTPVEVTPPGSSVAASTHDGNVPANAVDDSLATRWSANGDGQWLQLDLGTTRAVTQVRIATYNGHTRQARFDLQVATAAGAWNTVLTGATTSGTTTNEEAFDLGGVPARWIRYVGHGNSDPTKGTWNSVAEVSVFAAP